MQIQGEKSYFCLQKRTMVRKTSILFLLFVFLVSCGANKESRTVKQAERQEAHLAKKAERTHKKMVRQHYRKQRKETRKTLKEYKRRAKKMNRSKRFHPYIWFFQS